MYDDQTNSWEWDTDSEETRFSEGTIWYSDKETQWGYSEWGYSYLGEGEYHPLEEKLSDTIQKLIGQLNNKENN
jgi:hypothetical protein